MVLSVWPDVSGRADKIILPGLPAVGDGLSHLWAGGHMQLSATGSKKTAKEKKLRKSVKAPLWHKPKRNGPCFISLNLLFRHEAKPFSSLMRQSAYVRPKSFCTMVCRRKKRFYGKSNAEIHIKRIDKSPNLWASQIKYLPLQ